MPQHSTLRRKAKNKREAKNKAEKRAGERIFEVAADLFYRHSIRSVGVETIVKQADVAKISLYRNFASKDDLIVTYLENRNAAYWRIIDQVLAEKQGDPRAQLRALIAYIAERTTTPGYRGCPFINYAAEFPDESHPGHRVAAANKREMRRRLIGLIEAVGTRDGQQLADALCLVIDGCYASSQTLGGPDGPGRAAVWAADALIERHLKQ